MGFKAHNFHTLAGLSLTESFAEDNGYIIGFGGKRFTLWSYTANYDDEANPNCRTSIDVFYLHNLSDNRDKVESKFPSVPICMELKGSEFHIKCSSPSKPSAPVKKNWEDVTELPFGKYRGTIITDIHDTDYWAYMANTTNSDATYELNGEIFELKPIFEKRAKEEGAIFVNGKWCNPNSEKDWVRSAIETARKIEKGEPFSFVAWKNDNCFYIHNIEINFRAEDCWSFSTYYGGGRFLVVTDKKGNRKNKRTKGKTIEINDYDVVRDEKTGIITSILVNSFNIK